MESTKLDLMVQHVVEESQQRTKRGVTANNTPGHGGARVSMRGEAGALESSFAKATTPQRQITQYCIVTLVM